MIRLFYTTFRRPLPEQQFERYLRALSQEQGKKVKAYHRWEDQHRSLFGKLLLAHALKVYQLDPILIHKIEKELNDRPFIKGIFDFNITHSGEWVICAVSETCRIGVDVEKIKEVDLNDYRKTMTQGQHQEISSSSHPEKAFFRMWVIKESVIKAHGIGLTFHLDKMEYGPNLARLEEQDWYYSVLDVGEGYACAVASDKPVENLKLEQVTF